MADIERMRRIGDFSVACDRSSVADVALLVDEVSPRYQVLWESPLFLRIKFNSKQTKTL